MKHATELRDAGATLARAAAAKDYARARVELAGLANVCNRCHQAFRVAAPGRSLLDRVTVQLGPLVLDST